MPFFMIENTASKDVHVLEKPWEFDTTGFPFDLTPARYKAWWKKPDTKGCLLSLAATDYETGAYGTRLDKKRNPPRVLYGLMADYDGTVIGEDGIKRRVRCLPGGCEYPPQWAALSQSGKLHLFWLFERPVRLINTSHADTFVHNAMNYVKAMSYGVTTSDYDRNASECITQYIDIGKMWVPYRPDDRIPMDVLVKWSTEAAEQTVASRLRDSNKTVELPFEDVNRLIEEKFPGVSVPTISLGTRTRRFWDDDADNPTAAVAVPDGFVVFTPHDGGFKSWVDLFGQRAVDACVGGSRSRVLDDFFVVPRKSSAQYYRKSQDDSGNDVFLPVDKEMLKLYLKTAGFKGKARKGEETSELDRAILTIHERNTVLAAAPFLYFKPGIVRDKTLNHSGPVLNTSSLRVVDPDNTDGLFSGGCFLENPQAYKAFPFMYELLVSMFCESRDDYFKWKESKETYNGSRNIQLNVFLSWLSHFYVNAYRRTPSHGQALYLVGPSGCGKTFLASHIIPALMGGKAAAGDQYFLYGANFTREISESPVIVLDDVIPASEYASRTSATQKVKNFVASGTLKYEPKGVDSVTVPFRGRLICTSNNTERDLTVLPTIDATTSDKFTILNVGRGNFLTSELTFLSELGMEATMAKVLGELPAFARFLLGWETPESLYDARWGVIGYQNDDIVRSSTATSPTVTTFLEVLSNYLLTSLLPTDVKAGDVPDMSDFTSKSKLADSVRRSLTELNQRPLHISALRLLGRLQAYDPFAMRSFTPALAQYALTQIASNSTFGRYVRQETRDTRRVWLIDRKILFVYNGQNFEDLSYAPPNQ